VDLLELSERGIKLAIDEPCIPIQVHAIVPTKVKEKIMPRIEFLSTGYSKLIAYHHNAVDEGMTDGLSIFAYLVFRPRRSPCQRDRKAHEDSGLAWPRSNTWRTSKDSKSLSWISF
jgi:hypothetical protein